jgi:ubiquitin-protein ligase
MSETRLERLTAEWESLRTLATRSNVFEVQAHGDPPDRYTVEFHGRGLCRDARGEIAFRDSHSVDIRLPYAFPQSPPDIRWLTPIFHPNVSYSGFINISDVGLNWDPDLGLDVLCERLWDVARVAFLDLEGASNYAAKNWFSSDETLRLPLDARPLRDKAAPEGVNIIRYERRDGKPPEVGNRTTIGEVLYIGEDTPVPELPLPGRPPIRRRGGRGDDILYIGDD